jgi:hypothetical protein
MIRDGAATSHRMKRGTEEVFYAWIEQSERLWLAREHHGLRGDEYTMFAARIGIDKTTAKQLPRLYGLYAEKVVKFYQTEAEAAQSRGIGYVWPGWKTALAKMKKMWEPPDPTKKTKATGEPETEEPKADDVDPAEKRASLLEQIVILEQRERSLRFENEELAEQLARAQETIISLTEKSIPISECRALTVVKRIVEEPVSEAPAKPAATKKRRRATKAQGEKDDARDKMAPGTT